MNDQIFFASIKASLFGGRFTPEQVAGLNAILSEWRNHFLSTVSIPQFAYCLATTFHETGTRMIPVMEGMSYSTAAQIQKTWKTRFPTLASAQPFVKQPRLLANKVYNGRMGNRVGTDDGWNMRGTGLVQLTGLDNFARGTRELRKLGILTANEDMVATPSLALRLDVAVALLFVGMEQGWFTGKTLDQTIDDRIDGDELRDFTDGRRIINGTDKAEQIGAYGMKFLTALVNADAASASPAASVPPVASVTLPGSSLPPTLVPVAVIARPTDEFEPEPAAPAAPPVFTPPTPPVFVPVGTPAAPSSPAVEIKLSWLERLRAAFPRK